MALFAIFVTGSNASTATASTDKVEFSASPYGFSEAVVRVSDFVPYDDSGCPVGPEPEAVPALFTSKEDAETVGWACRWNNQRFVVRAARGSIRSSGRVVELNGARVVGCQEGWLGECLDSISANIRPPPLTSSPQHPPRISRQTVGAGLRAS